MQLGIGQAMKEPGIKPNEDVLTVSAEVPAIVHAMNAGEATALQMPTLGVVFGTFSVG